MSEILKQERVTDQQGNSFDVLMLQWTVSNDSQVEQWYTVLVKGAVWLSRSKDVAVAERAFATAVEQYVKTN